MKRLVIYGLVATLSATMAVTSIAAETGRPGSYRLLESNDPATCQLFATILAASPSKSGDLDFSSRTDKEFWRNLSPELAGPPTQSADFDIDNDAQPDRVFRVAWSLGGKNTYALYIDRKAQLSSPPLADRNDVLSILKTATEIDFIEYGKIIKRLEIEYGRNWEAWWMVDHVIIEPIIIKGRTYLIAWNYQVPLSDLAKAYVFKMNPDGSIRDVCMFGRICACNGCQGRQSTVEQRLLPNRKYCR